MPDRDLRLQQRGLLYLLLYPGNSVRAGVTSHDTSLLVRGDSRLESLGRVGIYREMQFVRFRELLADAFPKLSAFLGNERFEELVEAYLRAFPPAGPDMAKVGQNLVTFAREQWTVGLDWLPDLAALELARYEAYDDRDDTVLTLEHLRELPPSAFDHLSLVPITALRLLELRWGVAQAWKQLEDGQSPDSPEPGQHLVLVWRQNCEVLHRVVNGPESSAVLLFQQGSTFKQICALLAKGRRPDLAARLAFETIGGWIKSGMVRNVAVPAASSTLTPRS